MTDRNNENSIGWDLDNIREAANRGYVPPRYLLVMEENAAAMRRTKNAAIRRRFSETMESLKSCGILSRMDSHHWDLGLCELELEAPGEIICAVEGYVLCFDNDEWNAAVYSPEEVRAIGGAKF